MALASFTHTRLGANKSRGRGGAATSARTLLYQGEMYSLEMTQNTQKETDGTLCCVFLRPVAANNYC
jgi:hypothetical protein